MRKIKHAVQVGLYNKAEYRFIPYHFHGNWRQIGEGHLLPLELDLSGKWMYHGVDCNPGHIKNFKDEKYERYYQYAITDTDGESDVYDFPCKATPDKLYKTRSLTIESFFDVAGVDNCNFLVLDIEGWEYRVIESYTGRIPIDFISIEYHPKYKEIYPYSKSRAEFEQIISDRGFEIECCLQTNRGEALQYFLHGKNK